MSAYKETLIFCDGGQDECPEDGPFGSGDSRHERASAQREGFPANGWLHRKGKDYCPACAKRLFGYVAPPYGDGSGKI